MSGNKLLTENTVRRFMKLANVGPLTDNFISENFEEENVNEEEENVNEEEENVNEEDETVKEEAEDEMEVDMGELGAEDEMAVDPEMDVDADMGDEPEMAAADMSLTEEEANLLIDLGKRLEEVMQGQGSEEEVEEEPPLDDAPVEDEEVGLGDEEEDAAMNYGADALQESKDALVQEVLKRVTKRIVEAKIKNKRK